MFKMIAFFVLFLASFASMFFAKTDIQFFAAVTAMCLFAFIWLQVAIAYDKKLMQSDLYDHSAE